MTIPACGNCYNKHGPLFIWYDNEIKKKYQFHFETESYMDERDNKIDADLLTYFIVEHPVLKKFFLTKLIENIENNKEIIRQIKTRWREAEPYIMRNPKYAYKYAKKVLKRRWPAAELYIMQDPEYAVEYAIDVLKSEWREAEPYIMQDPEQAYYYAKTILKSEWPAAERYIMQNPKYAYYYALTILKRRWPAAEPYIMQDTRYAKSYIKDVLNKIS